MTTIANAVRFRRSAILSILNQSLDEREYCFNEKGW